MENVSFEEVKWPISSQWLQEHQLLATAMKFGDFERITEAELIADSTYLYLTISELRQLEPLCVYAEDGEL